MEAFSWQHLHEWPHTSATGPVYMSPQIWQRKLRSSCLSCSGSEGQSSGSPSIAVAKLLWKGCYDASTAGAKSKLITFLSVQIRCIKLK
jgi:hypothetical protein